MLKTIGRALNIILARGHKRRELIRQNQIEVYRAASMASYVFRWLPFPLETIFTWNGTDKHSHQGHRYGPAYRAFFSEFRYRRVNLLEIGIGGYADSLGGRSITAWRWYFPFLNIVACDIEDKSILARRGVTIKRLDQSSAADLSALVKDEGPFDIIIDDGSHRNDHQIFTFEKLFPALREGGVYVIEDTQTSYWPHEGGASLGKPGETCMTYFTHLTHYLNACEFLGDAQTHPRMLALGEKIGTISFYHNLIFIKKDSQRKFSNMLNRGNDASVQPV